MNDGLSVATVIFVFIVLIVLSLVARMLFEMGKLMMSTQTAVQR